MHRQVESHKGFQRSRLPEKQTYALPGKDALYQPFFGEIKGDALEWFKDKFMPTCRCSLTRRHISIIARIFGRRKAVSWSNFPRRSGVIEFGGADRPLVRFRKSLLCRLPG